MIKAPRRGARAADSDGSAELGPSLPPGRPLAPVFFHFLSETRIYVPVILGIATVLGAYFASGVLRVTLIVLAVLLGALVVWDILVAAYVTILAWGLKTWIDRRRARKAHRRDRA
jgi:hypothetical protein